MATQHPSHVLDQALMEAALQAPRPTDPIGQRRLGWLSALQRRLLQSEIHVGPEPLVGAFLMAYYDRLRLHPEVMARLRAGQGAALRRAPDVAPLEDAEPTVALPRLRVPWPPSLHELESDR